MKENLQNWVFTYNPYEDMWIGCKREDYSDLFNGGNNVIKSQKINTLVELIKKYDDVKTIKKNVK